MRTCLSDVSDRPATNRRLKIQISHYNVYILLLYSHTTMVYYTEPGIIIIITDVNIYLYTCTFFKCACVLPKRARCQVTWSSIMCTVQETPKYIIVVINIIVIAVFTLLMAPVSNIGVCMRV